MIVLWKKKQKKNNQEPLLWKTWNEFKKKKTNQAALSSLMKWGQIICIETKEESFLIMSINTLCVFNYKIDFGL